jgi:hypothetical protein
MGTLLCKWLPSVPRLAARVILDGDDQSYTPSTYVIAAIRSAGLSVALFVCRFVSLPSTNGRRVCLWPETAHSN